MSEIFDNGYKKEITLLEKENKRLSDIISDYRQDIAKVLDEKCPSDERHCGCVPILREQISKYQKAFTLIITMRDLSQAITISRNVLKDSGKYSWSEESVGEYWANQLEILQDKFDTLEDDYKDVCKKRLDQADSFSKRIIELENSNRALLSRATAAEAHADQLQAEIDAAGDNVMEIIAQALSGDCQRYLNYDLQENRYCKWGIVEKDIRAIFKKDGD